MKVETIAIIRADALGREIACLAVRSGYRVVLEDISPAVLEQAKRSVRKCLEERMVGGELAGPQAERALANLSTACSVEDACREADLLIDLTPEEMEVKLEIFTLFDKFAKPDAILASHTGALPIAEIAAITFRPETCTGIRFLRPERDAGFPEAVFELAPGRETSAETIEACLAVARRMGREAAVARDTETRIPHARARQGAEIPASRIPANKAHVNWGAKK